MPVEIITNSVSAVGSLVLLLNPPSAPQTTETLLGDRSGVRSKFSDQGSDFTAQYIGEVAGNVSDGMRTAYGQLSRAVRDLRADASFFTAASDPLPDCELVIETEYQIQVWPGFAVQPGMQCIVHPGGSSAIDNAPVLGLRILEF